MYLYILVHLLVLVFVFTCTCTCVLVHTAGLSLNWHLEKQYAGLSRSQLFLLTLGVHDYMKNTLFLLMCYSDFSFLYEHRR